MVFSLTIDMELVQDHDPLVGRYRFMKTNVSIRVNKVETKLCSKTETEGK